MVAPSQTILPYCGAPPLPDTLWSRWNLDPVLIAGLLVALGVYAVAARAERGPSRAERAAFYAGWGVASAALISPLCALSVSLFAARVGQHMLLTLVAAPLIAAGRPFATRAARQARHGSPAAPLAASGVFAVILWFWHMPGPYAATFASTALYWTMHLSLFGAALWLWSELLDRAPAKAAPAIGAGLVATVQMGLLGALITLAPEPLYAPHALTTVAWGLTQLQDQQVGGVIMWVPGCVVFLGAAMLTLGRVIAAPAQTDAAAP